MAWFYQLKIEHEIVRIYLTRIGKLELLECWWCRKPVQIVEHCILSTNDREKKDKSLWKLSVKKELAAKARLGEKD